MQDCQLIDLGCNRYLFTWSNNKFGPDFVEEMLDRFLCNKEWRDIFDDCAVSNLETWTSNHCPVLMEVNERGCMLCYKRKNASRVYYEDMWSSYEACQDIIKREWSQLGKWNHTNPVQFFEQTTQFSMAQLKCWSMKEFGERQKKLQDLLEKLKEFRFKGMQYNSGEEIKIVKRQIHNILVDEKIYWKQRSRADWLKEGDKNTKIFPCKSLLIEEKNKIWGIEDSRGNWTEKGDEVETEFCDYFVNLFTTTRPAQEKGWL